MLIYWIWYAQLTQLSPAQKLALLRRFSDPEDIYFSDEIEEEQKDLTQSRQIAAECQEKGIKLLTFGEEAYPKRLRNIFDPPMVLYFKGTLPDWDAQPVIGVVGTRKATPYGLSTAEQFGKQIAACGGLVISGAASGIDTMAMQGALSQGKPTVGVLGCGADVVYPRENRGLFAQTCECGCLLTEYPPRTSANGWHFPRRNRIISGIANGLLVVEAPEKSGALNSAHHAWEQGRDVFAVPGNVGVAACAGSNALLQDRAKTALSGWDVVKEYQFLYPGTVRKQGVISNPETQWNRVAQERGCPAQTVAADPVSDKKSIDNKVKSTYSVVNNKLPALSEPEQAVLACISGEPVAADEVIAAADLPAGTVRAILTRLTLKGLVSNHPGGRISLK